MTSKRQIAEDLIKKSLFYIDDYNEISIEKDSQVHIVDEDTFRCSITIKKGRTVLTYSFSYTSIELGFEMNLLADVKRFRDANYNFFNHKEEVEGDNGRYSIIEVWYIVIPKKVYKKLLKEILK